MSAERNVTVVNPLGIAWVAKFYTLEAAWRRLLSSQRQRGETDMACEARLRNAGWKVVLPTKMA